MFTGKTFTNLTYFIENFLDRCVDRLETSTGQGHGMKSCTNGMVKLRVTAANAMRPWSDTCFLQYWKLGSYVARLPAERWAKRVLEWEPDGRRSQGRPREVWDSKLAVFCTTNNLGRWEAAARDSTAWLAMADDFIMSMAVS